jgi:hypothetical protein
MPICLVSGCENSRMPLPHGHGSKTLSEPRAPASGVENRWYANFRKQTLASIEVRGISPKIDSPLILRAFAGSADILYWMARAA